jgi:hypothetical protein
MYVQMKEFLESRVRKASIISLVDTSSWSLVGGLNSDTGVDC